VSSFRSKIYDIVAQIPEGKVATYGQIAALSGNPRAARAVGWEMHRAPGHLNLPCHRVVNKAGILAPDYVFGGADLQREMLEQEGITFTEDGRIDMVRHLWIPLNIL
jgi:methylated-DNA-protein-cysteine methyltransferase-like protein